MSSNGDRPDQPDREAFRALEEQVSLALEALASARTRAAEAEVRGAELEELLQRFTADESEAGRLLSRLAGLESENADLRDRISTGREGVQRLLARVRFLESQR